MSIFLQQLWTPAVQIRFSWSIKSEYCCSVFCIVFLFFQSNKKKRKKEMTPGSKWGKLLEWFCTNLVLFVHSYMCNVSETGLQSKKLNGYQIFPFHVWNMQNHFPCLMVIQFYRVSKYFFPETLISRGIFNLEINIPPLPKVLPWLTFLTNWRGCLLWMCLHVNFKLVLLT